MSSNSRPAGSGSHLVAAGILLSRLMGLVRQKVFAHFLGSSDAADAFYAALKIPNFLQNLLGDGVLSASFIPVYARLQAKGEAFEADRVAGLVGTFLLVANALLVALGVTFAHAFIDLVAPGFTGEKRELTIRLVQILFPGTALLVMSAWCLGVLNSHRKFFLSYAAPVIWNLVIIGTLLAFGGGRPQNELAVCTSWGVLAGSLAQFAVQWPVVRRHAPGIRAGFDHRSEHLRQVFRTLVPVVMSRGAVQVTAYIDNILASLLPAGAVSALAYAQSLYLLPISLFGMSVSAAELPAMSSFAGSEEELAAHLRKRMGGGLRQIAFFIIPSVVGFWALGDSIVGALYQGGAFRRESTLYVWGVLAGSTVGLLATTLGRLYSSAFYALRDTRTPFRFALARVFLATALGWFCGLHLPRLVGLGPEWGTAGLTASAGMAGWVEFLLLRNSLRKRIGWVGLPLGFQARLWGSALLAGAAAFALKELLGHRHPLLALGPILGLFGLVYFPLTMALGVEEPRRLLGRFARR